MMRSLAFAAAALLWMAPGSATAQSEAPSDTPSANASGQVGQALGEVRAFGFNYCPRGWLPADGKQQSVATNIHLFSLYGTKFGGNGTTSFALPNLIGRLPVNTGGGQGLKYWEQGEQDGQSEVTQIPAHTHDFVASSDMADAEILEGRALATFPLPAYARPTEPPSLRMNFASITPNSGARTQDNMMPTLTINYCVSMSGVMPRRP
ncbi:MAG: tail fiber protein [Pseudomonadota bacterium]